MDIPLGKSGILAFNYRSRRFCFDFYISSTYLCWSYLEWSSKTFMIYLFFLSLVDDIMTTIYTTSRKFLLLQENIIKIQKRVKRKPQCRRPRHSWDQSRWLIPIENKKWLLPIRLSVHPSVCLCQFGRAIYTGPPRASTLSSPAARLCLPT